MFKAGVQEAASAEGFIFDGHRERGSTQTRHPGGHSLYCFSVAMSGHVKKNEEWSDVTEIGRSGEDDGTQDGRLGLTGGKHC